MELYQKLMAFLQSNVVEVIAVAALLNIEYFLGKTTLIRSGSTLELAINVIKMLFEKILGMKKPTLK